jgi:hypothetical protein
MPTIIESEKQEMILETFRAGIRALGLAEEGSIGAAKGDIKLTPSGPMIGEIAARLSGGYMSGWTYPWASGAEPTRAALLAALGRKPEGLRPLRSWTSAERAFISIPGRVKSIHGLEAARSQNHVKELFLRIGEGSRVSFPVNNVSKCGNVISAAPDRAAAAEAAERACRTILIRLETGDDETKAFLAAGAGCPGARPDAEGQTFPPGAFRAGPEIRAALLRLPEPKAPEACETPGDVKLISFPEFASSEFRDYAGRTVRESLEAVRLLTGLSLPEVPPEGMTFPDDKSIFLGRSFWAALVRGGYQGGVYFIDSLWGKRLMS